MKTILLTGASGFIGPHVLACLHHLSGWQVICMGRSEDRLKALGTPYIVHDLEQAGFPWQKLTQKPDLVIHLAWQGLPNYNQTFHLEKNLMANYWFLKEMIQAGVPRLAVAGTCYEYGLHEGSLAEDAPTRPVTAYGLAKDCLHRFLTALRKEYDFGLTWLRLFFMYGLGQPAASLLPLLEAAVKRGDSSFAMSRGEQLRDYLPVSEAASRLCRTALQSRYQGAINICAGQPISVRRLVEEHLSRLGVKIELDLGAMPYVAHEPMAFWGDAARMKQALAAFDEEYGDARLP